MDFSSPFLHAETHNARQVHHTRNRILLALWGNRSLQSTQLLLLPKNWTLDTTNHSRRQLVISVKNNPQASAMSCYIHIKMMQIHQTNNRLTKSFCSSATRSFLVSSATYKGCSLTIQPDHLVAVVFLHHPGLLHHGLREWRNRISGMMTFAANWVPSN